MHALVYRGNDLGVHVEDGVHEAADEVVALDHYNVV